MQVKKVRKKFTRYNEGTNTDMSITYHNNNNSFTPHSLATISQKVQISRQKNVYTIFIIKECSNRMPPAVHTSRNDMPNDKTTI
jgi:hypothetical protein